MVKVGDIVEYDNLQWKVVQSEPIYVGDKNSPMIVIAKRILKDGSLGTQSICYNSHKMLTSMHRYKGRN